MEYRYCPVCGGPLGNKLIDSHDRLICRNCEFVFYQNPTPAVGVVLVRDNKVLLVKRKFEPKAGGWSLPAGFMEYDEGPEETAIRETLEETNLDVRLTELLGAYGAFDDPRVHVVLIVYRGEIIGGQLKPGDDAVEVQFFPLTDLPKDIAFSSHCKVLECLIKEQQ